MTFTASFVRLCLNSLLASFGVLLGASVQFLASSGDELLGLGVMLALAIAAGTAAEMLYRRPRATGVATDERRAGAAHGQPNQLPRHDALTGC